MMSYTQSIGGVQLVIINPRSSLVQKGRWDGVNNALNCDADKILFIDSDQTFPHDALIRLINHGKEIIGATYRLRQTDVAYTARDKKGRRLCFKNQTGLHEVASNGLGFTLIDAGVFRAVGVPWFNVTFKATFGMGRWVSEDEHFFKAAHTHGYTVWVDADLTKEVGHIGTKCYI
jgi:hypothetical protein